MEKGKRKLKAQARDDQMGAVLFPVCSALFILIISSRFVGDIGAHDE